MKKKDNALVDEIVNIALDVVLEDQKAWDGSDSKRRAKVYRKAGLELIELAATMDVERWNSK